MSHHNCHCADYASTTLRAVVGVTLVMAAIAKFTGPGVAGVAGMVAGMAPWLGGLGKVYGTLLPFAELILGAMLLLGFWTRYTALLTALLFASFIIGVGVAQLPNGITFLLSPSGEAIPNKDFAFLGAMVAVYLLGPGAYAMDNRK